MKKLLLLGAVVLAGCMGDGGESLDDLGDDGPSSPDMPESSETDLPGPPTIEGDGTVVAEIHPDADTTIQFVVDEPDDEDASVDLVIVGRDGGIDYGRIVEEGTHKDLLRKGGLYADLWQRQSGGFLLAEDGLEAAE